MNYADGVPIKLGDAVSVPVSSGEAKARVVMLGDTYEHLDIDPTFLSWVKSEGKLDASSVVLEWIGANPLSHNDPKYAPVGNYLLSPADQFLIRAG